MQNPVDQKKIKPIFKINAQVFGFPLGGIHGNHHIPQQFRMNAGKIPLLHGKRHHIGGAVPVEIPTVEVLNPWIIGNHQGELSVRTAQGV